MDEREPLAIYSAGWKHYAAGRLWRDWPLHVQARCSPWTFGYTADNYRERYAAYGWGTDPDKQPLCKHCERAWAKELAARSEG